MASIRVYYNGTYRDATAEEIADMEAEARKAKMREKSRPLTSNEVSMLFIQKNINTVITDDATASRAVEYHPALKQDGSHISSGTRINWKGQLKRAAADLWDTAENNPDNAPALWEDISYKDGFRIIPETITAGTAFALDEYGWWGDVLYRSLVDANIYTPAVYPAGWEVVSL